MDEIIPWTFMSNDLVKAVSSGDVETVEELINNGADLNAYDSFGNSLLWIGYINNYHEIIFMLLNAGINVNAKSGKLYMCDMHRALVLLTSIMILWKFKFCRIIACMQWRCEY